MCFIDWALVLEYLKVFLSAPVIFLLVLIIFIRTFKTELRNLVNRIASIRFPGGAEVNTPQPLNDASSKSVPKPTIEFNQSLPAGLTKDQEIKITHLIRSHIANSYLWEYRYLNFFLVRKTQLVLDWLTTFIQPVAWSFYDSFWILTIPDANERKNILEALQAHHLIEFDQLGMINLTAKGKEYIEWRGPLPKLEN